MILTNYIALIVIYNFLWSNICDKHIVSRSNHKSVDNRAWGGLGILCSTSSQGFNMGWATTWKSEGTVSYYIVTVTIYTLLSSSYFWTLYYIYANNIYIYILCIYNTTYVGPQPHGNLYLYSIESCSKRTQIPHNNNK